MSDTSCKWVKSGSDWWEICAEGPFDSPKPNPETDVVVPPSGDTLPGLDDPNEVTVYGFRNPNDRYITESECNARIEFAKKEAKKKTFAPVETPKEQSIWQKILDALITIRRKPMVE